MNKMGALLKWGVHLPTTTGWNTTPPDADEAVQDTDGDYKPLPQFLGIYSHMVYYHFGIS